MLRACAFDLGNTLSDDTTLLESSLADVAAWLVERGALRDPALFAATYRRVHEASKTSFISHTFGERVFFEETFLELGVRGIDPTEALAWYRARVMDRTCVDPEVPTVLAWLRTLGLRIGIISNERTERVRAFLEQTHLASHFDVVVVSEDVGIQKPDHGIFRLALERLGTEAQETAMFGDSEVADGACRGLGMVFVLVTRYRRKGWGWEAGATHAADHVMDRIGRQEMERFLARSAEGARHG
jgi:FMN phosphatase YigB (HAD superfamily)